MQGRKSLMHIQHLILLFSQFYGEEQRLAQELLIIMSHFAIYATIVFSLCLPISYKDIATLTVLASA